MNHKRNLSKAVQVASVLIICSFCAFLWERRLSAFAPAEVQGDVRQVVPLGSFIMVCRDVAIQKLAFFEEMD